MRYFHRTSLDPDSVLAEADTFFGTRLAVQEQAERKRSFSGTLGNLELSVRAEGGHYTLITASTDQPGESELDNFARRFLGTVHSRADGKHRLRGNY